jgi:hypothetical protein
MTTKLLSCDCEFNEVGEGVGNVKGYELVIECNVCKSKREADNAAKLVEEQAKAAADALKEINKQAAITKLLTLGLTQEEINSLLK